MTVKEFIAKYDLADLIESSVSDSKLKGHSGDQSVSQLRRRVIKKLNTTAKVITKDFAEQLFIA